MEQEFEDYWGLHKKQLMTFAPQDLKEERLNSSKMNTAGDWLLAAFPIIAMIFFLQAKFIQNEMLNFVCGLAICIVLWVLCEMAKPYVTGKRSVVDIDKDIKEYFYGQWKDGKLDMH
ncbi:MAG: hypothetical protein LKG25_00365 [Prevotella sp.]|jgi:cell division protein FtsW (lipid II flippase)|nr:hypothetical protein [Prevotella sp.]MCI1281029.1 hypothetical protein [Prevotella sp.]